MRRGLVSPPHPRALRRRRENTSATEEDLLTPELNTEVSIHEQQNEYDRLTARPSLGRLNADPPGHGHSDRPRTHRGPLRLANRHTGRGNNHKGAAEDG
jgi:hypothetical protein